MLFERLACALIALSGMVLIVVLILATRGCWNGPLRWRLGVLLLLGLAGAVAGLVTIALSGVIRA